MTFRPIDRVAEQHYFFRRRLADALTQYHFTEERSAFASDCSNYEEYWRKTKSDRFFDMSTLVRAGAAVEEMLKSEYVRRKATHLDFLCKTIRATNLAFFSVQHRLEFPRCSRCFATSESN